VAPERIAVYLDALDEKDRALWATAFYAGNRRGELQALTWPKLDLASGVIRVDPQIGAYDQRTRSIGGPKSEAGDRRIPVSGVLREYLLAHKARAGARPRGLVFARHSLAGTCNKGTEMLPFNDSTTGARARKRWIDAGLDPVTLHDARHTFASL